MPRVKAGGQERTSSISPKFSPQLMTTWTAVQAEIALRSKKVSPVGVLGNWSAWRWHSNRGERRPGVSVPLSTRGLNVQTDA